MNSVHSSNSHFLGFVRELIYIQITHSHRGCATRATKKNSFAANRKASKLCRRQLLSCTVTKHNTRKWSDSRFLSITAQRRQTKHQTRIAKRPREIEPQKGISHRRPRTVHTLRSRQVHDKLKLPRPFRKKHAVNETVRGARERERASEPRQRRERASMANERANRKPERER